MSKQEDLIIKDFLSKKISLRKIAEKHDITLADTIGIIKKFISHLSNEQLRNGLKKLLNAQILSGFIKTCLTTQKYAEEIGMSEQTFTSFIYKVIEDREIIVEDKLASHIFCKVMREKRIMSRLVPNRIVKYIATCYVTEDFVTQRELSGDYSTFRDTISLILKRGIAEDILDDELAEKVYHKVLHWSKYGQKSIVSYDAAFEKRKERRYLASLSSSN